MMIFFSQPFTAAVAWLPHQETEELIAQASASCQKKNGFHGVCVCVSVFHLWPASYIILTIIRVNKKIESEASQG
jgi:hypothetical protein